MNLCKVTVDGIDPRGVRQQVSRILASDGFVRCGRMRRFLEFIVEETLAGRSDQLGEYAIGLAVFDRGQNFEPALDPIVRNDARRLRLKLAEYYRQLQPVSADVLVIDVPKGGYVPVFLPLSSRKETGTESSRDARRLAVLPFEVLSAEHEGTKYSRSLCMSLTASLTNIDGVEAMAFGYIQELPTREAASELRLSHVIQGSIVASSDRCRVIVNLVHAPDGAQLWAREYNFETSEPFVWESEITGSVLREVTARLGHTRMEPRRLALVA